MLIEPFLFQKTGIEFLNSRERCLLADEMGLGKSLQAIAAAKELSKRGKTNVLVICPASLTLMWDREIRKCLGDAPQIIHLRGMKDKVELTGELRFVIVSYNYLQKEHQVERLRKVKWHGIVADEAHKCKNWKSKTCKGLVKLAESTTGHVWLMTGTPATKSGQDYYPYLAIIQPGKWGTFREFSDMFCNVSVDWWSGGKKYEGVREDKKPLLRKAFSKITLRRLKQAVIKDLPDKIVKNLPVEVDPSIVAECLEIDPELIHRVILEGRKIDAHVMKVMRSIGMAKVDTAVEYALDVKEPLVIFCTHTDVLHGVREGLEKEGRRCGTITGENNREAKDKAVQDFQNGALDVILCNIRAGGVGITLTRSSHMLFVEQSWSPADIEQAIARTIRIGQVKRCVNITNLIAHKTLDEQILGALVYKSTFMKQVMGDDLWIMKSKKNFATN